MRWKLGLKLGLGWDEMGYWEGLWGFGVDVGVRVGSWNLGWGGMRWGMGRECGGM